MLTPPIHPLIVLYMPIMPVAASAASHSATSVAASAAAAKSIAASAASLASTADFATIIKPFTPDAFANGFATLVGALIGAMLAYVLQRQFQKSVERKNAQMAAHRLMFSLLQQINTILLIHRDFVFKEVANPGRFLSIPATPPFDMDKNVLQLSELAFLLDAKEGRAILYDFYMAQENYVEALLQWNLRSALHLEKVQPALAASGIASGAVITEETLKKVLGAHLFGTIVNSTNNCVQSLQRAFQSLAEAKVKARAYLVRRFKSDEFADFDVPETYGLATPLQANGLAK